MNVIPESDGTDTLNPCAYLLVWSWRLVVTRRGHCPLLGKLLRDACGDGARDVSAALGTFLCALARTRRRRLEVNPPGCPVPSVDEKRMLDMVAAAQYGRRAWLDAHLCWMARPAQRRVLEQGVQGLAASLVACRLWLPLPACPVPMPCRGHAASPATLTRVDGQPG